jgi:putative peptidoglycan lipid II flippase
VTGDDRQDDPHDESSTGRSGPADGDPDGTTTAPSNGRNLGRATTVITFWNLVSRLTGFVRVLATTAALGVTILGDTYQRSSQVSNVLFELLAGGMLFSVLVPSFVTELRHDDRTRARQLASALMTRGFAALGVLVVIGIACNRQISSALSAGAQDDRAAQVSLGAFLLVFILPQLLLYLVGSVASALLQADHRFAATSFAPVLNNVVVTATMVAFTIVHDPADGLHLGLHEKVLLGGGTLLGTFAMTVVPLWALHRAGLGLRPRWRVPEADLRELAKRGLWGAGHVGLNETLVLVTVVLAGWVAGGAMAYQTAFTFFLLPHAMLAHPIFTALYPRLSHQGATEDRVGFAANLGRGLRSMLFLLLPAGGLLAVAALPGLSAVHLGQLNASGARVVALVLASFLVGLCGYSTFFLLTRASYALGDARTPTLVNLGITVSTVGGMVVATRIWDGTGLLVAFGLVTSGCAIAGSVALYALVRRRLGVPVPVLGTVWRSGVAAALATAAALGVALTIGWSGRFVALVAAGAAVVVGLVVDVAVLSLLGEPELEIWRDRVRKLTLPVQRLFRGPRRIRALQAVLLVAITGLVGGSLLFSQARTPRTVAGGENLSRVVVFTVPGLSVDDLDADVMPTLDRLASRGAIAVTNVRTASDRPNLVASYASLSAGNRTGATDLTPVVFGADDQIGPGLTIRQSVEGRIGRPITGDLVVGDYEEIRTAIAPEGGTQPGALADAAEAAGHHVAVVSNTDDRLSTPGSGRPVPAAMAAADGNGVIGGGSTSPDLLRTVVADDGEEQRVADPAAYGRAVRAAQADNDIVIVDPGDTIRTDAALEADAAAEEAAAESTTTTPTTVADGASTTTTTVVSSGEQRRDAERLALRRTDAVLARVESSLRPGTLLIVVGLNLHDWALTPVVATGAGVPHGYLDSASTHRPALITLTDLAPTILSTLGVDTAKIGMIGQPLRYRVADSSWSEARQLDKLLENRTAVDSTMTTLFVAANLAVYGGVLLLLALRRRLPDRWRPAIEFAALTCGAWPVSTYLLRIGISLYNQGATSILLSWAIAAAIAAVATRFRSHRIDPVLVVALLTIGVLVLDLATGAHLQVGSFFGYMPHTAPRFVGLGNSGFAILAGATVAAIGALLVRAEDQDLAWWAGVGLALLVVLVDGAPWMGTDVGGIIALVPVLGLMLWVLRGHRLRARTVLIAVLLAVAVLAIAVGIDALRPPSSRTHIGRFFLEAGQGSNLLDTIRRKWNLNMAHLRDQPLVWLVPILTVVGAVAVRRLSALRRALPSGSAQLTAVVATVAAGVLGWLANDSGVIVLALTCVFLGPFLVLLTTSPEPVLLGVPSEGSTAVNDPIPEGAAGAADALAPASSDASEPPRPLGDVGAASTAGTADPHPSAADVVVAIVPAKDRADSIAETVAALGALGRVDRVLVVDDGSSDDTAEAAHHAGADVLRLTRNRGKGGAVLAGLDHAGDATVILLIDADLARTAAAADALLDPVLDGRADLTVGVLPSAGNKAGFGTIRKLSAAGIRRACGLEVAAPLSGQRAIRADLLRGLRDGERFGLEVAMTIDVARAGGRVLEVPVPMDHRHTGRSLAGFSHRGRQGIDIARSLWPRLTGRGLRAGLLVGAVVLWTLGSNLLASRIFPGGSTVPPGADKVLVIGIPGLGLDDVDPSSMPRLGALAERGTLGQATPRTGTTRVPANAYATIGSGDRNSVPAVPASIVDAADPAGPAAARVLSQAFGTPVDGAVLLPTMPRLGGSSVGGASHLGALGDALHARGHRTGVVANSTVGETEGPALLDFLGIDQLGIWPAPAALAAVDHTGSIDAGTVSASLLRDDPTRPFGVTIDEDRFVSAVDDALGKADVVFADPGEMDRATTYRPFLADDAVTPARDRALATTDRIIGRLTAGLDDRTLVVVVGLTPPRNGALTPVVLAGGGWSGGRMISPSTRQADLVTFSDLAPTILAALDAGPVPNGMIGQPLRHEGGSPSRSGMDHEQRLIRTRDSGYPSFLDQFVWGSCAVFAAIAVLLVRRRRGPSARVEGFREPLRIAILTTAAAPTATFVVRALGPLYRPGPWSVALVWALAFVGALAARRLRGHRLDPLFAISLFSWVLLTIDLTFGGRLQVSSYLGYTPSVAARFVGLGNAAFGVYGAAAVVVCALLVARSPRRRSAWPLAAAVAVVTVIADGAPWLGADVGGILTLVPVFGVVLWLLSGRRASWRLVGGAALGGLAMLGVAVGIEALRPAADRTHIGRFFLGSDGSGFWPTIERKWSVNVQLLETSTWSKLIWGALAFGAVALLVGGGRALLARDDRVRIGLVGLAGVALLGWLSNDSGPLVAALVLGTASAYLALLVLDPVGPPEILRRRGDTRPFTPVGPGVEAGATDDLEVTA